MISFFPLVPWLVQATAKGSVAIALMGVAYVLIGRRVRAQWWYALWAVIVLRLIVPVAPSSTWSVFNFVPPHPGIELQLRGTPSFEIPWWIAAWKLLVLMWLSGFLFIAARSLVATIRMQSLVRRAIQSGVATQTALRIVEEGRRQLNIKRRVHVIESPLIEVPALHGAIRPTLLLPEGVGGIFAEEELRHIIFHEFAHLRRNDVAVNWLLNAVRMIHWFNPLAWFAVARMEEERELACDELTLSCLAASERLGYGRTILKLLERFRSAEPVPALVGIVNQKRQMQRRLMMISNNERRSRLMVPLLALVSAIGFMALTDAPATRGPKLDPASVRTLERFDRRIDLHLTNAPLPELLTAVSARSGVAVTQSPSIASSDVQRARFTLHADRAPARAILSSALLPYGIVAEPKANAVNLTTGPPCMRRHQTTKQ
jgi:bla regulator protein BlaR1